MKIILKNSYILLCLLILFSCSKNLDNHDIESEKPSAPQFNIIFNPDNPGCGDCHRNKNEPEYTLASKANERWVDHNFDLNDKLKTINDCLLCHSVEKGGREGSIAPTTLRTIVHQTHKSNSRFEGNCFTCHYIMGDSSSDLYNYQN